MAAQRPLSLREAITLSLENNKDIEVTRENVRIAEFDLQAARGVYEPRFAGEVHYERATVPNISFFTPEVTKVTNDAIAGNADSTAYVPKFGTVLTARATNSQTRSTNLISIFSPQYNSELTF